MPDLYPLRRVLDKEQALKLKGEDVPDKPATLTRPGIYVDAETDAPIFVYLPMPEGVAELRDAVRSMQFLTTRRAKGMTNASRTFGMAPRRVALRREACRATSLSRCPSCVPSRGSATAARPRAHFSNSASRR